MKKPKIIFIGIDGATWKIIDYLIENNKLPNINRMLKKGLKYNLESSIPPVTFPAWGCMFSGLNPGNLGVFEFIDVDVNNRSYKINSPNSLNGDMLWNYLNKNNFSVGVIGVPTAKIEKVRGFMVGGPFLNQNQVYPKFIKDILKKINYIMYPDEITKILSAIINKTRRKQSTL